MYVGQNCYRKARVWYNRDGSFGQVTGWLLHLPYYAWGGITAINEPVKSVTARLIQGPLERRWIRFFGRRLTTVEQHGREIWTYRNTLYDMRHNTCYTDKIGHSNEQ